MWVDEDVVAGWRQFIEAVQRRDVPIDVLELMVKLDHAILTSALQVSARQADYNRAMRLFGGM